MPVRHYVKRPVVVEAIRFTERNGDEVVDFMAGGDGGYDHVHSNIWIRTLEGVITANVGDYVIRGLAGEYYPCREDIFLATYEAVEETA